MRERLVRQSLDQPRRLSMPLAAAGGLVVIAAAASGWLWAHYGTAVFFESIRTGFAACFG
jgi:hypothetical protein